MGGFWIGFGKVWGKQILQILSKTLLGGARSGIYIGFEQVFCHKLSQTLSKTLSRNLVRKPSLGRVTHWSIGGEGNENVNLKLFTWAP
jgi:hypothetical protein